MNTSAKVSVIIPNYNHSSFLKQRIDSVLNQTYQDLEVIILDDCSTDNSVQVIDEYRNHPKISTILINTQNSGSPFLQWKKGMEMARGEWVWIAESDDWCEPVFLDELINNTGNDVSVAFCQSIVVNQNGKKIWQSKWHTDVEEMSGKDFIHNYLSKGNYIFNASMCVFRKKFSKNVSEDFTRYKYIGDWVFWLEMASLGNIKISGKQLNYFRKHDNDVSGKAVVTGLGYHEYFLFIDKIGKDKLISDKDRIGIIILRFYEFLNDKVVNKEYRKEIYKKFRSRLGIQTFYFHFKNWAVKNIKNRLINSSKRKATKFENFSAYP